MGWLVWLVIAWFVAKRILKVFGDVQKTIPPNQSGEDSAESRNNTQIDRGLPRPARSWGNVKRMGHEPGPKTARGGGSKDRVTAAGSSGYRPAGRYKKKPSPLSKKRRKSKVKVRAGWFS